MPQVLMDNSDLLHIAGARNTQVQYLLDGVEVGDPASNGLSSRMIVEAVRTAEIQTGRFGAEYAHPGGAILSYETREGDDQWRFNATDFIPGINIQEGVQLGNYYPRVTFSGPIVPDELWFSQSFDVLHTLAVQKGLPPGAPDETQQWGGDSWSRLLWKMSDEQQLACGISGQRGGGSGTWDWMRCIRKRSRTDSEFAGIVRICEGTELLREDGV